MCTLHSIMWAKKHWNDRLTHRSKHVQAYCSNTLLMWSSTMCKCQSGLEITKSLYVCIFVVSAQHCLICLLFHTVYQYTVTAPCHCHSSVHCHSSMSLSQLHVTITAQYTVTAPCHCHSSVHCHNSMSSCSSASLSQLHLSVALWHTIAAPCHCHSFTSLSQLSKLSQLCGSC